MDVLSVQSALLARGVKLSPPATKTDLERLGRFAGSHANKSLFEIYSVFDGFEEYDRKSQILIWPIHKVIQMENVASTIDGEKYIAFGDVMIESDFLMVGADNGNLPVRLLHEGREMAVSMLDFLKGLSDGRFDFLS